MLHRKNIYGANPAEILLVFYSFQNNNKVSNMLIRDGACPHATHFTYLHYYKWTAGCGQKFNHNQKH